MWLASGLLGAFILSLVVSNFFIPQDKAVTRQMLGHDFLAFYAAGSFVRDGRYHDLYNLDAIRDFEQATSRATGLEVGKSFGPWWNPPFYAMVFQPLAAYSYIQALNIWRAISAVAALASIAFLTTMLARAIPKPIVSLPPLRLWQIDKPPARAKTEARRVQAFLKMHPDARSDDDETQSRPSRGWAYWLLVPTIALLSMPFIQAFSHGQNTFTSLLLLCITIGLWRREKGFVAGLVGGLLFYKPQLAAVVAGVMLLDLGIPAVAGFTVMGLVLLGATQLIMPGSIGDFLHQLPANVRWMQVEHTYLWERHVTLKAFWRLLFQGREAGEALKITTALSYASIGAMGLLLLRSAWRSSRVPQAELFAGEALDRSVQRDRLIAATISTMPLLMPFYFDYDLLLLSVPITLYAAERIRRPELVRSNDKWLTRSLVCLYLWTFVNPGLATLSHVNLSVIFLSASSLLFIARANREPEIVVVETTTAPTIERPRLAA